MKAFCSTVGALVLAASSASAQTVSMSKTPSVREGSAIAGGRLGFTNVDTLDDNVLSFGAFGDFAVADNVTAGATLDYWAASEGAGKEKVQIEDLSVGANTRFIFTPRADVKPFVKGGLALHRFNVETKRESNSQNTEIERYKDIDKDVTGKVGIDLGGGVIYQVQRDIDLTGEVLYRRLLDRTVGFDQLAFTGALSYRM